MHIFISYSKKDIEFARHVRALLKAENFPVWMDEEGISGGDEWEATIEKNLNACIAFVIIMSPDAKESDWVKNELLLAQKLKKSVFPILFRGDAWWNLAHIQYEQMQQGLHANLTPKFVGRLREIMPKVAPHKLILKIAQGDITDIEVDVIAVKHAQNFYGADLAVARWLGDMGKIPRQQMQMSPGAHVVLETKGSIPAQHALFLGVPPLVELSYNDIQSLGSRALSALKAELPTAEHLAMTIHGAGYGLDENAALAAQVNGYLDAVNNNELPSTLQRITIVEYRSDAVTRLQAAFEAQFGDVFKRVVGSEWAYEYTSGLTTNVSAASAQLSQEQAYTFVLMSSDPSRDDYFYYGIQSVVHGIGDLCARMDLTMSDAEIISQIKQKIDGAHLVVADLTSAPTPALLYLGYAWGKNRPTILVKQKGAVTEVGEQDVLLYERIRDLEDGLRAKIGDLKAAGQLS